MSSSSKSYRPPNVPALYYENQKYGFVGIQIALVFYGIAAVLFIQAFATHIRMLRKPGGDNRRSKKIQLAYTCAIFTCGTILIVADAHASELATLEYPLYPGGGYAWTLANYNDPIFMLTQVPFVVTTWLADGFMLYRCYVVYTATAGIWYILFLPLSLYLACIVTAIMVMVQTAAPYSSIFALLRLSRLALTNFALTASLNILITALISIRLILHRTNMKKTLGSDSGSSKIYASVSTILVESSALYSIFSLMFIVTYGIDHPSGKMFLVMLGQIQVIAPLLVVYRLSKDRAWTTETSKGISMGAISTIHFNDPGVQVASQGVRSSTGLRVSRNGESLNEMQISFGGHGQEESMEDKSMPDREDGSEEGRASRKVGV